MEKLSWAVALVALFGTWLNVQRDRRCFYIWTATNSFWIIYDTIHGLYAQVALFTVYLILSLMGIKKWRREDAGTN